MEEADKKKPLKDEKTEQPLQDATPASGDKAPAKPEKNNILSNEESSKLDELDWSDITSEITRNRQMLRDDAQTNLTPQSAGNNPDSQKTESDNVELQFLHDVPLKMQVEVGSRRVLVNEVLNYKAGSIVELDNEVGRKLNVYVNGVLVGFGVITQKDQKYGIKITDLLNEKERMQALSAKAFDKD